MLNDSCASMYVVFKSETFAFVCLKCFVMVRGCPLKCTSQWKVWLKFFRCNRFLNCQVLNFSLDWVNRRCWFRRRIGTKCDFRKRVFSIRYYARCFFFIINIVFMLKIKFGRSRSCSKMDFKILYWKKNVHCSCD